MKHPVKMEAWKISTLCVAATYEGKRKERIQISKATNPYPTKLDSIPALKRGNIGARKLPPRCLQDGLVTPSNMKGWNALVGTGIFPSIRSIGSASVVGTVLSLWASRVLATLHILQRRKKSRSDVSINTGLMENRHSFPKDRQDAQHEILSIPWTAKVLVPCMYYDWIRANLTVPEESALNSGRVREAQKFDIDSGVKWKWMNQSPTYL